jgi:hypothetical protein
VATDWYCTKCKHPLDGDHPGVPCSNCGSTLRTTELTLEDTVKVYPSMRAIKETPGLPRKKRMRVDLFQGWELRKSVGDMVKKLRRIDRDTRTYEERVETEDGTLLHECKEPLDQHKGHGSDKLKCD